MPRRFPADEDFPRPTVIALREAGFDIAYVLEDSRRTSNEENLRRAQHENRVLLTFDTDFGELVFAGRCQPILAVILCRVRSTRNLEENTQLILTTLLSDKDWAGKSWVIEPDGVRARPVPPFELT